MQIRLNRTIRRASAARIGVLVASIAFLTTAWAGTASAELPTPVWNLQQQVVPTHLQPGGVGSFSIVLENLGSVPATSPVTVTTRLPDGVTATAAGDFWNWDCPTQSGSTIECTLQPANLFPYPELSPHSGSPALAIQVAVDPSAGGTGEVTSTIDPSGSIRGASRTTPVVMSSEPAQFGLADAVGYAYDRDGTPARQAGGHPDVVTNITWNTINRAGGTPALPQDVKDVTVDLPKGLIGNPTAVPTCDPAQLGDIFGSQCPPETQVGSAEVTLANGSPVLASGPVAVYNVDPPTGSPGRFAFNVSGVVINLDPVVRTGGDYGITARIQNISQTIAVAATKVTLWGVPADPLHDKMRYDPALQYNGVASKAVPRPFMTAPTECSGQPLATRVTTSSWQTGATSSTSFDTNYDGSPLATTGCEVLPFTPGFEVRAESAAKRGAPAGIGIDLTVPQNDNPDGLASANLKTAVVTLPEGMVVNPSSAQGLAACSPGQIDINGASDPTCPESSKIGSVDIDTPLLSTPLQGSIYLAAQRDNPFGTTLALYLVAKGSGVVLKLPGRIDPNPVSGRVTATFDNNPQLPFEKLSLHFKTGPRAPLSLPTTCGPATTTAVLTPWSGTAPVTVNTSFEVSQDGNGAPCPPRGFAPGFTAGTSNPAGGKDSPFTVAFSRSDDDQELGGVTVNMPRGLLARIASVNLCGEAQANAGTCGEDSKIGNVTTAAGAGSNPFSLPGRAYITGSYKGGPFGLSIVVPAVAGPFNLGTVVVRAAIFVDRNTAELRIVSDPLPTILEGIPLQIRLVEVKVDRPGFTFNPTNCAPTRVSGQVNSIAGAIASVSSRFQAGGCSSLPFKPKMTLKVGARGKLMRGKRTPLEVTLTMPNGQANNRSVRVTLPKSLNARLDVVNRRVACTIEQFRADRCPMVVGTGTATTPVLRDPLRGPAYFVYNPARRLPDLVVRLKGQVNIDLVGKVTITRDLKLETTFDTIPDAPITKFRLQLESGSRNGPIGLTQNACLPATRKGLKADLAFTAQNGKKIAQAQTISVAGCGKARSTRRATKKK